MQAARIDSRFLLLEFLRRPITASEAARFNEAISLATATHDIDVAMRRVAKGQMVNLTPQGIAWEDPTSNPTLSAAIELLDERRFANPTFMGAAIGSVGNITAAADDNTADLAIMFLSFDAQPGFNVAQKISVLASHEPWWMDALSLRRLAPAGYDSIAGSSVRLAVLRGLTDACASLAAGATQDGSADWWTRYGVLETAWSPLSRSIVRTAQGRGFRRAQVTQQLNDVTARSSNIARRYGSRVMVDLAAASSAIVDAFERPIDGAEANAWGLAQEGQLQAHIDNSLWRPPDYFRSLIGSTVRRADRTHLTDLDAIAFVDSTLILIDNKSFPSTDGTRLGGPSETETRRQRVEAAAASWKEKCHTISDDRSLLNVSVADDISIDGIVIVPDVPFVNLGPATDDVLGLYRACSVAEFLRAAGYRQGD